MWAQTPSGEISGVVSDASGSVMPGVRVTLTNVATNNVRLALTNESGVYTYPAVHRKLHAESGARGLLHTERSNVQCRSAAPTGFLSRSDRPAHRRVSVTADTPIIQTANASIGTVIENLSIVELPLNGRNYLQLASLIPGATTNGPTSAQGKQRMGGQRNSFGLNVAGQRLHFNHYSLDSIENTDLNFNSYMLLPSVDALEEFKVESGIFGANSAAPSRRSTQSRSPARIPFTAPSSSSSAIPRWTRRIISIRRTSRFRRSSATSTGPRSAGP